MNREIAKNKAMSRDCHCVKGKDRDNNYNNVIDEIFEWHEREVKNSHRSAYIVDIGGEHLVVLAKNIADAYDKLDDGGFKNYHFTRSSSIEVI